MGYIDNSSNNNIFRDIHDPEMPTPEFTDPESLLKRVETLIENNPNQKGPEELSDFGELAEGYSSEQFFMIEREDKIAQSEDLITKYLNEFKHLFRESRFQNVINELDSLLNYSNDLNLTSSEAFKGIVNFVLRYNFDSAELKRVPELLGKLSEIWNIPIEG